MKRNANKKTGTILDSYGLKSSIQSIIKEIGKESKKSKNRLKKFEKAFNKAYPKKSSKRMSAEVCLWIAMDEPIILYALNMNGQAIVSLHAIIEKYVIITLANLLGKSSTVLVVKSIVQKKSLGELIPFMVKLDVFNKKNEKFLKKLVKLRNGIAHRNEKLISDLLYSGKELHHMDIESKLMDLDMIPIFIQFIDVFEEMFRRKISLTEKEVKKSPKILNS